jgi:hypothetical protein
MAATNYPLTPDDWTDCGAADDCLVQLTGGAAIVFTVAAGKPAAGSAGVRLSRDFGDERAASVLRPSLKVWARSASSIPSSIAVER